jgi:GDPmannose 4,6-dehydratase
MKSIEPGYGQGRKAFITGITGQDGSFLAEYLLELGYEVHGLVRKVSHVGSTQNIDQVKDKLHLHIGSMNSFDTMVSLLSSIQPHEIYNLAAQSHVQTSYDIPMDTADMNYLGVLRMLEAMRIVCPAARFYQASTSEMFGKAPAPQGEGTPFAPTSTYSCAKIAAYYQVIHHRQAHGLFAAQGLLFNHESERRPDTFVTRKITKAAARIKLGLQTELRLGNLETARDWGYAKDYVRAMHLMLQHDTPEEFVIATGVCTTLKQFLTKAFEYFDLDWTKYVVQDPAFMRPLDHHELRGDWSKAHCVLGWEPKTDIDQLVSLMCAHDLRVESGA